MWAKSPDGDCRGLGELVVGCHAEVHGWVSLAISSVSSRVRAEVQ